ncbi:MAG: hypothetical protein IRY95_05610 [Clostridia bacterium]|nr:hypothetical protein [Clostridia bacterium]
MPGAVVAYVGVDINPSLELAVDGRAKVTGASALNADGGRVLAGLSLAGMSVEEALARVADRAVTLGYLGGGQPAGALVVTVASADDVHPVPEEVLQRVAAGTDRVRRELTRRGQSAVVETLRLPARVRREAEAHGLSPGRYALLRALQRRVADPDRGKLDEEFRREPLAAIFRRHGADLEGVLEELRRRVDGNSSDGAPGDVNAGRNVHDGRSVRDGRDRDAGKPIGRPSDRAGDGQDGGWSGDRDGDRRRPRSPQPGRPSPP